MQPTIPSTRSVYSALLRADLTTQWRNRRASIMAILIPAILLSTWKNLPPIFTGPFKLSNAITIGLAAIGLMGYSNTIARDREKGIFQRLRVAPAPNWTIMGSRLTVQLVMITILNLAVFLIGHYYDEIDLSLSSYVVGFFMALLGGCVYLGLSQVIVGLITNPETVNSTSRLIYITFIMTGMFGEFGVFGKALSQIVKWSPYGTVKRIVSTGLSGGPWDQDAYTALLLTIGYTLVFTAIGIKKFRWNTR